MEHFVELIKAVAWPAAIVWLGYIFRAEVRSLLNRVSTFKYKDVEASFEKGLFEAELASKSVAAPNKKINEEELSQKEVLLRISEVSPRAAVVEAWTLIETAALRSGLSAGATIRRTSPKIITEFLESTGKFSLESLSLIEKLRKIRNQATHMPDFAITQSEAERYLELATMSAAIIDETVR